MKRNLKFLSVILSVAIVLSSCIGSFALTSKVKDWNDNIGSKFVNELVFLGMCIVPVYPVVVLADAIVLNSIEFWSGETPVVKNEGDVKIVKNSNGEDICITTKENGYTVSNGEVAVNLVFDEADNSWNVEYENQTNKLVKMLDDKNAVLYLLNGETMTVPLDDNGMNLARRAVIADYAKK